MNYKSHILSLVLFVIIININLAQNIERQVIASSGETLSNGSVSMDFTLGELAITTITDGSIILTQGFHQTTVLVSIQLNPVVFLQGALLGSGNISLMRDDLRSGSFLPVATPYTDGVTCNALVFNAGGTSGSGNSDNDIVDWVWVELRDANDNTNVIEGKSALLQKDGNIVALDGLSALEFDVPFGDYYISVNHRNHLAIISDITFSLNDQATVVDFTDSTTPITFGTNAQMDFGNGVLGLWAGDLNNDGRVRFAGPTNDSNVLKNAIINYPGNITGSTFFPYTAYDNLDLNLNGQVRFSGPGNDSNVLKNIIVNYPTNVTGSSFFPILEQMPN